MFLRSVIFSFAIIPLFLSCNSPKSENPEEKPLMKDTSVPAPKTTPEPVTEKKAAITYQLLTPKDSIKKILKRADSVSLSIIALVNRADIRSLRNFDSLVSPVDTKQELKNYFPFPQNAAFLKDVKKILFFSYPTQTFAAYENGILVRTGPTSMGKRVTKTPLGLFYTNWKAEETISTVNDEWKLKWNFNIQNKMGIGFHEYAMPGYPASHSCLRLPEGDAKYLYTWADQWKLNKADNIAAYGTPVIVFGSYPFGSSRPWLALAADGNALNVSEADLENTAKEYLQDIMQKQAMRENPNN